MLLSLSKPELSLEAAIHSPRWTLGVAPVDGRGVEPVGALGLGLEEMLDLGVAAGVFLKSDDDVEGMGNFLIEGEELDDFLSSTVALEKVKKMLKILKKIWKKNLELG